LTQMQIIVKDGQIRFIYSDDLQPLLKQGDAMINRVSHVEPTPDGQWQADLSPVAPGLLLGPFPTRKEALAKEVQWLIDHHIPAPEVAS